MSRFKFNVGPINSDQFIKKFMGAVKDHLNGAIKLSVPAIQARVGDYIVDAVRATPEYNSLVNQGQLYRELGVLGVDAVMKNILDVLSSNVQVTPKILRVSSGGFTGGLDVSFIRKDHSDILSLPTASFISQSGFDVRWLNWLLTRGDGIILIDYIFVINGLPSRTGVGHMRKVPGKAWRIPPQYSGTIGDNFITRAFARQDTELQISTIIEQEIKARI